MEIVNFWVVRWQEIQGLAIFQSKDHSLACALPAGRMSTGSTPSVLNLVLLAAPAALR